MWGFCLKKNVLYVCVLGCAACATSFFRLFCCCCCCSPFKKKATTNFSCVCTWNESNKYLPQSPHTSPDWNFYLNLTQISRFSSYNSEIYISYTQFSLKKKKTRTKEEILKKKNNTQIKQKNYIRNGPACFSILIKWTMDETE